LDPHKDYLLKRWNSGCRNVLGLFGEIQQHGYSGSYDTVARYARRLRAAQGLRVRQRRSVRPLPTVSEPQKRSLTPRRAAWLVLLRPEQREPDDEQLIKLMAAHPALTEAIELAQGFAALVRQRRPDRLDGWLAQALQSSVSAFQRFAKSLHEDYEAVKSENSPQSSSKVRKTHKVSRNDHDCEPLQLGY
jgi:transposase